jgi:hypothetical protein
MEVREHFYADDPGRGPSDVKTTLSGVDYFFLGNGLIQAAIQVLHSPGATPLGLLVTDPDKLKSKRAALTMDAAAGLGPTMISVRRGRRCFVPRAGGITARWTDSASVPSMTAEWRAGGLAARESFICPDRTSATLRRRVSIRNHSSRPASIRVSTAVPGSRFEKALNIPPGETRSVVLEYRLAGSTPHPAVALTEVPEASFSPAAEAYWRKTTRISFGDTLLDGFFSAAKSQLHAAVSRRGTIDGGIWQYNLEWVRDQAFIAMALVMTGQEDRARVILARLLARFISPEGAPMDSSRLRPLEECEPDQNGVLLLALKIYVDWTGDLAFVEKRWAKIRRTANFPLRPEFRHEPSGLIHNRREFWERHSAHGIEDGLELAHQVFIALGLKAAADLAGRLGKRAEAKGWNTAASRLEKATLHHPAFALVDQGRLIKRRTIDGAVQAEARPPKSASLPSRTPLFAPGRHLLDPDTSTALAVAWEFIDPRSDLARATLEGLEKLWNQRWKGGGYGRYHVTSEPDSPGPWPFASLFVARARALAGDGEKARRVLRWLGRLPGAAAGTWFEFYGPRPVPPYPQVGITPWTWAELVILFIRDIVGLRPEGNRVMLRPHPLPGMDRVEASFRVRGIRVDVSLRRAEAKEKPAFKVDGRKRAGATEVLNFVLNRGRRRIAVEGIVP